MLLNFLLVYARMEISKSASFDGASTTQTKKPAFYYFPMMLHKLDFSNVLHINDPGKFIETPALRRHQSRYDEQVYVIKFLDGTCYINPACHNLLHFVMIQITAKSQGNPLFCKQKT